MVDTKYVYSAMHQYPVNSAACRSAPKKPHHCSDNVSDDFLTTFVCLVQVDLKPASDVLAGAMARAASQSTIHPLDTLKVLPTFGFYQTTTAALIPI